MPGQYKQPFQHKHTEKRRERSQIDCDVTATFWLNMGVERIGYGLAWPPSLLERLSTKAEMSELFHAVVRGPSLTGLGKRPVLHPCHHALLLMGMSFSTCGKRKNPCSEILFVMSLFLGFGLCLRVADVRFLVIHLYNLPSVPSYVFALQGAACGYKLCH